MNLIKTVVLSGLAIVMVVTTQVVWAQEPAAAPGDSVEITSGQQPVLSKEGQIQWAWGEVTNLDDQGKAVTLKYLDYEADQEKDLVLVVDEKTTFENIKDFSELKLKDILSVDYVTGADNKNIAKNISFEKPDADFSPVPEEENSQPLALPPEPPGAATAEPASLDLAQAASPSAEASQAPAPAESAPAI
jgi:hypothetical protein